MGNLRHGPPGLPEMRVKFAGLVHAVQDLIGQAADAVVQGPGVAWSLAGLVEDDLNPGRVAGSAEVDRGDK